MPHQVTRIGDIFPSNSPLARYVTVLAMIGNDAARLGRWATELGDVHTADPAADAAGKGLFLFRLQVALLVEARKFLTHASRRSDAVCEFTSALPPEFQNCFRLVTADPVPSLAKWMKANRNGTFHYPSLPPEHDTTESEVARLLAEAAEAPLGASVVASFETTRFGFADEVVVQSLPDLPDNDLYGTLGDMVIALIRMVQIAVESYIASVR